MNIKLNKFTTITKHKKNVVALVMKSKKITCISMRVLITTFSYSDSDKKKFRNMYHSVLVKHNSSFLILEVTLK
jgi:hypothetical protein